jgi:Ca2+-transporting ATPase
MVRMVTGDFMNTAKSVAAKCGILTEEGVALTGAEFSGMSKLDLLDILPRLQVIARSSPLDKYRLVTLLRESGEVVAVTGDGSNDAIAMKRANCGLAMGTCGTELAKLASDIVVLDDDFSSIVVALKWGRCTYDNIRSFLTFQLAVSFAATVILIVGPAAIQVCPIKAIQLLWANVIIGAIGALALATAKPKDALLLRPPYGEDDPLVSRLVIRNIVGIVIYEVLVLLILLFGYDKIFGFEADDSKLLQSTLVFNTFQFCNIVNLLNARVAGPHGRACDGFFTNWYFDAIFVIMIVLQVLLVEFSGPVLKMMPLGWKEWLVCVGFGFGAFPYGFLVRLVKVEEGPEERLENGRRRRQELMREVYGGMSVEDMWQIETILDPRGRKELDKVAEV